jgi:sensor histidine kinase YesM
LVENAVKHNKGDQNQPLLISIKEEDEYIVVSNEIKLRNYVPTAMGNGLQNLQLRYSMLTDKPMEVYQKNNTFTVKVPLLKVLST